MARYTGTKCPICSQEFKENDDIVVCPDCGAPYHRECYKKLGHCKFEDKHGTQERWERPDTAKVDGLSDLRCPNCGTMNPSDAVFCQVCGVKLNTPAAKNAPPDAVNDGPEPIPGNPFTTPFGGLDAQEEIDGIPARQWALFVGKNSHYFLPRFKRMERPSVAVGANWSALFLNFAYFFYRKMYLVGSILLGIWAMTLVPAFVVVILYMKELFATGGVSALMTLDIEQFSFFMQDYQGLLQLSSIFRAISFVVSTMCALFANRIYFIHCKKKIKAITQSFTEEPDCSRVLARRGRTSMAVVAAILLTAVFVLFILPNIALGIFMA